MSKLSELSYSRLILRTQYYRDMTLDLERRLAYKQEEVKELKSKVDELLKANEDLNTETQASDQKTLDEYEQQLQLLKRDNEQLRTTLEEVKNNATPDNELEQKINDYEMLLQEIQQEINQKEQEIDYYKTRVTHLEKRSSYLSAEQVETMNETSSTDLNALAYFDYSIVFQGENKLVIRGDFHITNVSKQTLINPSLCFRFSPPEFANMRGQILSLEQAALNQQGLGQRASQWMFLESEWAKEAEERGEIWITSTENAQISAGETIAFNGFQISIQTKFKDTFIVEGFVYFADTSLKIKAVNNILMSY